MQNKYQIFYRKQDLGKRISLLHREEPLSVGLIAAGNSDELTQAIESYVRSTRWCVHVLMHEDQARIPELRTQFPDVTFIIFTQPVSFGAMMNAMANECYTTYFFIARSDLRFISFDDEGALSLLRRSDHPAAVTPKITNRLSEPVPTIQAPMVRDGSIDPISFLPADSVSPTLYPFFGLGMYERALFQRLRGFDDLIESDYWQFLDFGIRCWLYGYPVYNLPSLAVTFPDRQSVIEDRSDREGIRRCHTKALCVRQMNGKNYAHAYGKLTDSRVLHAEVKKRLALYKTDFFQLIDQWKPPEEVS